MIQNKQILSKADLAINGAPPAFTQELHVGRPNMGDKAAFMAYVEQIFEHQWLTNNGTNILTTNTLCQTLFFV